MTNKLWPACQPLSVTAHWSFVICHFFSRLVTRDPPSSDYPVSIVKDRSLPGGNRQLGRIELDEQGLVLHRRDRCGGLRVPGANLCGYTNRRVRGGYGDPVRPYYPT